MTEKAAENPTGNPAGKAIDFQALITEAEKNGYKVSHHFEKSHLLIGKQPHLFPAWLQALRLFHRSSVATS